MIILQKIKYFFKQLFNLKKDKPFLRFFKITVLSLVALFIIYKLIFLVILSLNNRPVDKTLLYLELQKRTGKEKTAYLESLPLNNHLSRYMLASFYIQGNDSDSAEKILKKDIKLSSDLFHKYESMALLTGLYLDLDRALTKNTENYFDSIYNRAVKKAEKLLRKEEKKSNPDNDLAYFYKRITNDLYQYTKMMGDYHFKRKEWDSAYENYSVFYSDLDRPVNEFEPQSMRNYVKLLVNRNELDKAIIMTGYIINLAPYMYEDIISLVQLFTRANDIQSAALTLLFLNVLSNENSAYYHSLSIQSLQALFSSLRDKTPYRDLINLASIYLSGNGLDKLPGITEYFRSKNYNHFTLSLLNGLTYFITHDYDKSREELLNFQKVYPYCAESYFYLFLMDMRKLGKNYQTDGEKTINLAYKVVELKPGSAIAALSKIEVGNRLKLTDEESVNLLFPTEIGSLITEYENSLSSPEILLPFIRLFSIRKNVYQTAAFEQLKKISKRKNEMADYFKSVYSKQNKQCQSYLDWFVSGKN